MNGEMLLLPRLGVLVVRVLFVKVRFVLVVVKGKVKKIPSWERRIGCRRDEIDVAGGAGAGAGDSNHQAKLRREFGTTEWKHTRCSRAPKENKVHRLR